MSSGDEFIDYYKVLQIESDASPADIKKSYFSLAKDAHPDAGGSTEQMQLLNQAYNALSDPVKQAAYNKIYTMHSNVASSDLDLKESDYDIRPSEKVDEGLEDLFVDQLYAEYYDTDKKPDWKSRFKKK